MYNHKIIEKKWQKYWEEHQSFLATNNSPKEKYYILVEFPYPSGVGLHVGHARSYSALDSLARKRRRQGYNVLFPMGWDAFGLPAEQYAIANHIHPKDAVKENIKTFKEQCIALGLSFDWSREVATTDPEYYKWTQWQFLKFYEHGLAYKDKAIINWCPNCKIGLSNEEAEGGVCERCGTTVVKKEKEQWLLRMKSYAEKLLDGFEETDFLERIKKSQINWIGKSVGASVNFKLKEVNDQLEVFTTRPDTIYGVTFMVMSPEHPYLDKYKDIITNYEEILKYKTISALKTDIERTDFTKSKTGVLIEGIKAINPVNNKEIPIWISDYVLMSYGTGAIMAVPAHDERDYSFAKKYNIDIIPVIKGGDISSEPYLGDGEMFNSGILNGLNNKEDSINKMITYLETMKLGKKETNYRLQDWVFSRQRFWGEPIPMIHCEHCGWQPVKTEDLPVTLPNVASYEPTETGESPLANITEWVNTTCPKCGGFAQRETDVMPNWAGSSWYFLRYMDSKNNQEFVSQDALNYWGMVDYYNGGMEHTTRHLLYARFWHRFMYDIGLVPFKEPFKKRVSHGMILGENGEKMSKSKGTSVSPSDMVNVYGADALRCYELFIGDYEKAVSWSENGLKGCKRFLDRVYRLGEKLNDSNQYSKEIEILINQTIKKVTDDLDNMRYNTAVSALMILLNELDLLDTITKGDYRNLLTILNPIAPHITEELNFKYQLGSPICESPWPIYDPSKLEDVTYEMVVQVNGKVRGKILASTNTSDEQMKDLAMNIDNVKRYIEGHEILKIVIIPKKLVSFVIKSSD